MAQPTISDVHINVPLTNLSIAYMQEQTDFAVADIFPPVPVSHKSDTFWKYTKGDWFRTVAAERAPSTESVGSGWTLGEDNFSCRVFAVHKDVDDQTRKNQDLPIINLDRDATEFVTRDMLLRKELDWAGKYFKAGVWGAGVNVDQTGDATGVAADTFIQWSRANSTPIEDIAESRINVKELTGYLPNVLVIGARVFLAWKNHSQFLERIKYSQKGVVTLDLIAGLMDVPKVVVPYVIQNTAPEGSATDVFSFIYGKSALLAYAAPNAGLMQPSAGYSFNWTEYSPIGTRVSKFRMENIKSDRIEAEMAYDLKVVCPDLAQFFQTAVQ